MVSIIIPSRGEQFLQQTINDIFQKAAGDIEVIAVLDGYWPKPCLEDHPKLIQIHTRKLGMRAAIDAGASIAKGKYLLKTDGHCMFDQGFDKKLRADIEDNWIVIPRRRSLDAEKWEPMDKTPVDANYLCYPWNNPDVPGLHGEVWRDRAKERIDVLVDEEMSFQGSCWFMPRKYYWSFGGMPEEGYGEFVQEAQQLGLRAWLSGGKVMRNKKTWYAHLHKGRKYGRGYWISKHKMIDGTLWSMDHWMNNRWEKRKHDIGWLINRFWPVPTWPDDWGNLEHAPIPIRDAEAQTV